MFREFKEFALRGNVVDMAIGIIIGAAFSTIVNSVVNDIIMPPIGILLGDVDFSDLFILIKAGSPPGPYLSLVEAQTAGAVTINYGIFINSIVSFIIVAVVLFFLVRSMNRLKKEEEIAAPEPTTKECPYCLSEIAIKARRCAFCTTKLE